MTQPPSTPDSSLQTQPKNAFSWRNWGRNGFLCGATVCLVILMALNFFQPWETSFSGSGYATTAVGAYYKTTTWHAGGNYVASSNAFSKGWVGWFPFLLLMGTLYILGKPRAGWNG